MARLRTYVRNRSESKWPQETRVRVCSPVVITTRPEASRSIRGQVEALWKRGGGPNRFWCANRSDELCIGAKDQSRLAIAGSPRDYSQVDLWGDRLHGRALIGYLGEEIPRFPIKLRMCNHRRIRVVRASGVILMSKRETTQPYVKVPKYHLSVIDKERL
jgi:hypothetical protein